MATEVEVVPNQNPRAVIIIPDGGTVVSGPTTDATGQVHLVAQYGDWLVAVTAGPPAANPE